MVSEVDVLKLVASRLRGADDTHPEIAALYNAMFARLSHEERAMMGCSMHDFSKKIILSQLESPEKAHVDIMIELFIRFYGQEFQGIHLQQILKAIRQYHSKQSAAPANITADAGPQKSHTTQL